MKKVKIFLMVFLCIQLNNIYSQESEFQEIKKFEIDVDNPANSKLSLLNLAGDITITTNSSNKITIEATGIEPLPKRAEGLKRIGAGGDDNTGLGLSQSKKENVIELFGTVPMNSDINYKFSLPKNLKVQIQLGIFNHGDLQIDGLNSDLEIDVKSSDIKLKEITGPTVISSLSGDIDIVFSTINQTSPFSIKSISGDVDISLPDKTPADLELSSISGGIFSDFDIKPANDKNQNLEYVGGGSKVKAKINNGGVRLMITSISGDIYLRKKK